MTGARFREAVDIAAGLVVASGAASALIALLTAEVRLFTLAFAIVSVVAFILGLPMYLAARATRRDTPVLLSVMGFIVGAAIPSMLVLAGPAADQASIGGTATIIDGSYTAAGWLQNLALVGTFGLLGTGAALLFWRVVRRREPSEDVHGEQSSHRTLRTTLLSVTAAGFIVAAFIVPRATADRSCHNPMRDGRNSIAPVASFDLRVGVDEWRAIESEMEQFRRAGEWLIRSDVRTDESFRWLQISMCRQSGTNIFVQGLPDQSEVSFFIFQPQGGSSWEQDFQTLYKRISGRWPTKIVFEDHQGRESSPPDWVDAKAGIGEATPSGNRNP